MFRACRSFQQILYRCSNQTVSEEVSADKQTVSKFELKNFSDHVKITITSGNGGNGAITFYTDKTVRKGKPDGGDGGIGGDVFLQTQQGFHDLSHLRRKQYRGNHGVNGGPRGKNGKNGGKIMVKVPVGTLVYEIINENDTERKKFITDLKKPKEQLLIAKGGHFGKGNKLHPSVTAETRFGGLGEFKAIYLELKILADIGLVGFPNIGKSTFLAAVSRALPKIANYQFTTLKPSVGHVKFIDNFSMTVADIPGIIEDAHLDKGLGLEFLKHIQRTKVLIIMLDMTKDPRRQYELLTKELKAYKDGALLQKPRIVVLNKKDCLENATNSQVSNTLKPQNLLSYMQQNVRENCFMISAKNGVEDRSIGDVLVKLRQIVEKQRQKQKLQENQLLKQTRFSQFC